MSDVVSGRACFPLLPALVHSGPTMPGPLSTRPRTPCQKHPLAEQPLCSPGCPGILGEAKGSGAWMPTAWPGGQSHSDVPGVDGLQRLPWGFCSSQSTWLSGGLFLVQSRAPRSPANSPIPGQGCNLRRGLGVVFWIVCETQHLFVLARCDGHWDIFTGTSY